MVLAGLLSLLKLLVEPAVRIGLPHGDGVRLIWRGGDELLKLTELVRADMANEHRLRQLLKLLLVLLTQRANRILNRLLLNLQQRRFEAIGVIQRVRDVHGGARLFLLAHELGELAFGDQSALLCRRQLAAELFPRAQEDVERNAVILRFTRRSSGRRCFHNRRRLHFRRSGFDNCGRRCRGFRRRLCCHIRRRCRCFVAVQFV